MLRSVLDVCFWGAAGASGDIGRGVWAASSRSESTFSILAFSGSFTSSTISVFFLGVSFCFTDSGLGSILCGTSEINE